eukprot:1318638-Amphidinium_carterae.1
MEPPQDWLGQKANNKRTAHASGATTRTQDYIKFRTLNQANNGATDKKKMLKEKYSCQKQPKHSGLSSNYSNAPYRALSTFTCMW